MRHHLLFALVLTATFGFSQSKKALAIEALERQRFTAMTQKDTAYLRSVLADDLIYLHSNGLLETKEQHLTNIGTGNLVYTSMEPVELKVRMNGRSAIINGVLHVTGTISSKPFDIRLRYTDVYFKRKGKWQLAAWQSLKLEDKK